MKNKIIFLVLGIVILVVGIPFITIFAIVAYLSVPQTREWTANYSFPRGSLATQHEYYNIGGVSSVECRYGEEILGIDYGAPYNDHEINWPAGDWRIYYADLYNRTKEAKLSVIFTDKYNDTLGIYHLVDTIRWRVFFVSPGPREIKIYLGSPLSLEELQEKGCYGKWNVTFKSYYYPNLRDLPIRLKASYIILGSIAILAGICVVTVSLKRISRNVPNNLLNFNSFDRTFFLKLLM